MQFLSDAEVALDVEGLHTLLKALEMALRRRIEDAAPGTEAASTALNAFGRVTITFARPAEDDAEPRAATAVH